MEEKILNFINDFSGCSLNDIKEKLELYNISIKNLKIILNKISSEGKLFFNEANSTYNKIGDKYKIVEILYSSKGHWYFIDENNKKFNIDDNNLNGALTFSKVIVVNENGEFKVVKVLEHKHDRVVCEVLDNNDEKSLIPMNTPKGYLVHINKKALRKLAGGDRVLIRVIQNMIINTYMEN